MTGKSHETLVEALIANATDTTRGFRFVGRDRTEKFYSFEQLEAEARRRAAHMCEFGIQYRDRVALVLPEPEDFVLTFLGAILLGAVPVPISPQANFKSAEDYLDVVAHICATARAKVLFTSDALAEQMGPLTERVESLSEVIASGYLTEGDGARFVPPSVRPDDLCFLQFTSGSTSQPKGVMVTHRNVMANAAAMMGPGGISATKEDHFVGWLPLFHDMGLIGFVISPITIGLNVTLIPTALFARSPMVWLETISRLRATVTCSPNFGYELVVKRAKERDVDALDLSTLRAAGCGAEPIRASTMRAFSETFGRAGFRSNALVPTYGMAEATLGITFSSLSDEVIVDVVDATAAQDGRAVPASERSTAVIEIVGCGDAFAHHEIRIVNDAGQRVEDRTVGEIITRGPSITAGYFENQEATEESWRDGWLHTGDLGYLVAGQLFICGRIKDLIIIRGANHYPQDIEWTISEIEGVRRGNVVAFSTNVGGTETLIVAAEATSMDAARLRSDIEREVMQVHGLTTQHVAIVPVGSLPKTSSGKTQRRKAKQLFERGELLEHS